MGRVTNEYRIIRSEGLEAWRLSRHVGRAPIVGVIAALWLSLAFVLSGLPDLQIIEAYAWALWLLSGLLLTAAYLGRRRSIQSYDHLRDLTAVADLLDVQVPDHPSAWRELSETFRSSVGRTRLLLAFLACAAAASLLSVAVDPPSYPGRGAAGSIGLQLLWLALLPILGGYVANLRGRRERDLRDRVHATANHLAAGEARTLREKLSVELDDLEARIALARQQAEDAEAHQSIDVQMLAGLQRIDRALDAIDAGVRDTTSGQRLTRRDWINLIVGAVLGAVAGVMADVVVELVAPPR